MTAASPPPPPAGWYPDPSGAPRQRYFDGHWREHYAPLGRQLAGPPPPGPPNKPAPTWKVLLSIGGILLVLVAIGSAIGGGDEKLSNAGSSSPSSGTEFMPTLTAAATAPAPLPGIGQEARDGKFAFVITAINSSKTAGDPDNPYMQQTAQGVYFNLHITVTNIGIEPQTFFATSQKVLAGNREFGADSMASVWTGAATKDINPGNSINVVVSFDVPAGTVVDTAELHDSAFSEGVKLSLVDWPGQ